MLLYFSKKKTFLDILIYNVFVLNVFMTNCFAMKTAFQNNYTNKFVNKKLLLSVTNNFVR